MIVTLRNVELNDLPIFFENQLEERSIEMTGFPPREKASFNAHWEKVLANNTNITKTIDYNGQVAGNIACFEMEGKEEIGYWLGRSFWGKGIASEALRQLLLEVQIRPLFAHVAKQNLASKRVLEKCGFIVIGEDAWSPSIGSPEIHEFILRLE